MMNRLIVTRTKIEIHTHTHTHTHTEREREREREREIREGYKSVPSKSSLGGEGGGGRGEGKSSRPALIKMELPMKLKNAFVQQGRSRHDSTIYIRVEEDIDRRNSELWTTTTTNNNSKN